MYPVTAGFQEAIYAPTRRVTGKVTFNIVDITAAGDVSSIVANGGLTLISSTTQLIDNKRDATWNLATLEKDRFRLDGSFSFPDDTTPANNGEVGYVGTLLCGADGVFTTPQTIEITFNSTHRSAGTSITFDPFNNEYAVDFNVSAYDAGGALIASVDMTGNTTPLVPLHGELLDYKKIVVTITKWNVGNRRVRVLEIDFGIVEVYTDDSLISFDLIEEMDMTSGQLPSPEFRFTVDNSDRAFNILTPTGFYKYLQQRQQIDAEFGVPVEGGLIEYVPVGRYFLVDWTSDAGALTASFTARTTLDLMANYDYEQLAPSDKTLFALASQLFATCGITNYSLDPSLNGVSTNSMAEKTDCKTMLQMVAIAGRCNVYITRGGTITLKRLTDFTVADRVDFDNAYDEPEFVLESIVKQVDVSYWTDLDTSAVSSVSAAGVDSGDTLKLEKNTLINTAAGATAVADWILAQTQFRAKSSINWRGNPAHELGDVIAIENSYGDDLKARITKNSITYQGYLTAQTEAKGAVS
ncbi:hypothetical protein [Paenibacillus sp. MMO-58]|uniref:hypothetical protein n=1 Tax=Paenibacillus sp. MMO-58 TaxID=3081290 RepID=UPI003016FD17